MANIVIGTTPTHIFNIDADLRGAVEIWISYVQGRNVVLNKVLSDGISVTEDTLTVVLTQVDTLRFRDSSPVKIQIRARFPNGEAVKSSVINTTADEILKRGVI